MKPLGCTGKAPALPPSAVALQSALAYYSTSATQIRHHALCGRHLKPYGEWGPAYATGLGPSGETMDVKESLRIGLGEYWDGLRKALQGLTAAERRFQPKADANHIDFIV